MDQKVKALWVEALRSGHYRQGPGRLKQEDIEGERYCCLGVLCDITGNGYFEDSGGIVSIESGDRETAWNLDFGLPRELREEFGITGAQASLLAGMNDAQWTFTQIADWIDAKL